MTDFIAYYRVSTQRQGQSGLGLEAQRVAVAQHVESEAGTVLAEFTEVESGRKTDRPELAEALALAKKTGATLVVAKLDRLARDAHFLLGIIKSGTHFVAADNPRINTFTAGILALVAEEEAKAISKRTKEALAQAKARGKKLGWSNPERDDHARAVRNSVRTRQAQAAAFATKVAEALEPMQGQSLQAKADYLNRIGLPTARGGQWHPTTVLNTLKRAA